MLFKSVLKFPSFFFRLDLGFDRDAGIFVVTVAGTLTVALILVIRCHLTGILLLIFAFLVVLIVLIVLVVLVILVILIVLISHDTVLLFIVITALFFDIGQSLGILILIGQSLGVLILFSPAIIVTSISQLVICFQLKPSTMTSRKPEFIATAMVGNILRHRHPGEFGAIRV